ncbi:hypothetical protein BC628DRAFT_578453 [Trametes gibbosa]|nr:hypothetical protein BC628DRAFT_578453 [Trametes gibbosa]
MIHPQCYHITLELYRSSSLTSADHLPFKFIIRDPTFAPAVAVLRTFKLHCDSGTRLWMDSCCYSQSPNCERTVVTGVSYKTTHLEEVHLSNWSRSEQRRLHLRIPSPTSVTINCRDPCSPPNGLIVLNVGSIAQSFHRVPRRMWLQGLLREDQRPYGLLTPSRAALILNAISITSPGRA